MADRPVEPPAVAAARRAFFVLGSFGLVVAALYLGRNLFVPLALAVLLTLVLGPVVAWLERRGLKRFPAVVSAAGLSFLLIGLAGWAVAAQVTDLLADLPRYKTEVRKKIAQLRGAGKSGPLGPVRELADEIEKAGQADEPTGAGPVVRVEPARPSVLSQFQDLAGPFLGAAAAALVVALLVITLLLYREDTRNRVIRLAGQGQLTVTTRALDEAGRRIGSYLLGRAAVNAGFGAAVTLGLFLLRVPYPVLWGVLAGAFRFVPSVGVWLVAPLPALLAFLSGGGPLPPVLVLGLFLVLELLLVNVVEPRVCGRSVGLAPVPLLLAVAFWTGLWGVVGLVLATPVTVCLAVLGKHVRQLRFLAVLLSKEAALRPAARYYQRLLARDRLEAEAVVKEYLGDRPDEERRRVGLFDRALIPALVLVRRGRKAGELRPEDEELILRTTQEIVAGLETPAAAGAGRGRAGRVTVLGVPAVDGADEVALELLRHLLRPAGVDVVVAAGGSGTPGVTAAETSVAPAAVLIAAVAPGGLTAARYLCRRLRAQYAGAKIVVGWWGRGKAPRKGRARLLSAGADRVAATLREARAHLIQLMPLRPPAPQVV
jgi:predicted PurR-regulated permease PerM